jgi:hypothetical protein
MRVKRTRTVLITLYASHWVSHCGKTCVRFPTPGRSKGMRNRVESSPRYYLRSCAETWGVRKASQRQASRTTLAAIGIYRPGTPRRRSRVISYGRATTDVQCLTAEREEPISGTLREGRAAQCGRCRASKKTRVLVLDSEDCDQMQGIQNS